MTKPILLADKFNRQEIVWIRPRVADERALSDEIGVEEVAGAASRMARFAPVLASLFSEDEWDGRVRSPLLDYPTLEGAALCLVKADHALPMTGSIKARGGVHELLCYVEQIGLDHGLLEGGDYQSLTTAAARAIFGRHTIAVASTGNLGYSIGLVGRAFGLVSEIHMSHDAKRWKKDRLRQLGATVIEHACDYTETVARARAALEGRQRALFVDDESSRRLLTGYATAAAEVAEQLADRGLTIGPEQPLVVYLPCGVGGAPGGITFGLKQIFGANVVSVLVEPIASACMLVALAEGRGEARSVYDYGGDNQTIADGLAVSRASELVLSAVGDAFDAIVAVSDLAMVEWTRRAWLDADLRLEPSAAAAFAAYGPLKRNAAAADRWPDLKRAVHVFWATGGSRLPDSEFLPLVKD